MIQRQIARGLFQNDLADVGGVHRDPSAAFQEDLCPAMLCRGDITALAEAAITEPRIGDAKAVHVPCRKAGSARQTNEQGVEVRTFPRQVSGLRHGADVPGSAAA
jgi:hypothetical protein